MAEALVGFALGLSWLLAGWVGYRYGQENPR